MSCACVIKQTLNCSFWTIQYTCFVISSIMSKLYLLFRPNGAWTNGTNLSLIDEVAMIKWVIWESEISQTSLVTYVFYCTFEVTIMWRTIEKSLKKNLRQLLLLRNHLKDNQIVTTKCTHLASSCFCGIFLFFFSLSSSLSLTALRFPVGAVDPVLQLQVSKLPS